MLSFVAFVVILSTARAAVTNPTGVVTCGESDFSMVISKAFETGKTQKVNIRIGNGKVVGSPENDDDCWFVGRVDNAGKVADPAGAIISQTDISGNATITYGADTSGGDGKAKCGGTLKDNGNSTMIEYTVAVEVVVRDTIRTVIDRELKYTMDLVCQLTKAVDAQGGGQSWIIDRASLVATETAGSTNNITFPIEINFHADKTGEVGKIGDKISTGDKVIMGEWIHIQVKETTTNALFKFVTKKCWFTPESDAAIKDTFFENYCPIDTDPLFDDFTAISGNTDPKFDMKVKAFFFTGKVADKISVSCDLFICLTDDATADCTQKPRKGVNSCNMDSKRRRRNALPELLSRGKRSVDDKNNGGWIEHRVVTSNQAILLDRNDVIVPTCGGDFVYDRVAGTCSNENLLEISGLYLNIPWNIDYANTSSKTFKDFANGKAYQLYVLMQMTDGGDDIVGLEVISAKKGSVILTVRIKYSARLDAASAFEVFQRAVYSPEPKRAANILNIRTEKVIEYVEVKRPSPSSGLNVENLTLIIVIVVLCAAVLISVVAVLKVRNTRRGASGNAEIKAHDNPNFS